MCSNTYTHKHARHTGIYTNTVQTYASMFTRTHAQSHTLHPITKANARIGLKRAELGQEQG